MQLELDEKLNAMDRLFVQAENLARDYGQFCENGFSDSLREKCAEDSVTLKEAGWLAKVNLEETADALFRVFDTQAEPDFYEPVREVIEKLRQGVKKMYLACIHDEGSYRRVKLENYYGTDFEKNALLVYIVYPFLFADASPGHTNQIEVKIMAEVLREKGYNVDIINTRYEGELCAEKYDFVIGFGHGFEQLCRQRKAGADAVYYLTESSPYFSNPAELKRLNYFYERNRCRLPFERQSQNGLDLSALSVADAAVCIGNSRTASTYEGMFQRIYPINATGFTGAFLPEQNAKKEDGSHNFLWYGGAGPVHKGLDICLEAFRELPGVNLHIVGEVHKEFYDFYRKDIEEGENIFYHGFLNKDSEAFCEVCAQCGFCIAPSCSEGQSTSVITAMFAGMIPVCTPENGLDMKACDGVEIESAEVGAVSALVLTLAATNPQEMQRRREHIRRYVWENHTVTAYKGRLSEIMDEIVSRKEADRTKKE